MKKWLVIIILAVSQFIMILDSSVMNVSISTVAADLGTTISGMQAAITLYALTMAAFMLTGGKLGNIWGRQRAFRIGSIIYGTGSLITALSPTLPFLLFGWSLVEGLGAVLVIPAIAALAAVNYTGKDRVVAFSILGAATGLAAAVGPIIGGAVTTYFSWRYVFAAETVIMIGVLLVSHRIHDTEIAKQEKLDLPSSAMAAIGMATLVFGALQSKTWGWIQPLAPPTINGNEIAPLGISPVAYLILFGIFVLWLFWGRQQKLSSQHGHPLLKVSLLKNLILRSGLTTFTSQYFAIAALFFVIPVYLQVILGYDALKTGFKLIPLSLGLILFSALGSRLSASRSARTIVRGGQLLMAAGLILILSSIETELRSGLFWIGMFIIGSGFGLLASQLGNINMSAVSQDDSAEVGGLQGTFQNLGTSFGTAIAGSAFMLILTSGFITSVQANPNLSEQAKTQITSQADSSVGIVSQAQAYDYVVDQGASSATAQTVSDLYQESQISALKQAIFITFAITLLALLLSRNLPKTLPEHKK